MSPTTQDAGAGTSKPIQAMTRAQIDTYRRWTDYHIQAITILPKDEAGLRALYDEIHGQMEFLCGWTRFLDGVTLPGWQRFFDDAALARRELEPLFERTMPPADLPRPEQVEFVRTWALATLDLLVPFQSWLDDRFGSLRSLREKAELPDPRPAEFATDQEWFEQSVLPAYRASRRPFHENRFIAVAQAMMVALSNKIDAYLPTVLATTRETVGAWPPTALASGLRSQLGWVGHEMDSRIGWTCSRLPNGGPRLRDWFEDEMAECLRVQTLEREKASGEEACPPPP